MQHDSAQKLFIPDKIKVGFQERQGTYTGKLAYVIYFDKKGVLRKVKSWQTWRDETIEARDFTNEPTEGFVLNKGVGGARHSYGWNARNEYIRVYDPRDFEFEISIANLLFILREGDCSRGKGLEGKFVYAWDGAELVLLPTHSHDYKASQTFTNLQGKSVGVKSLIDGATYLTRSGEEVVYVGRFDFHFMIALNGYYATNQKDKKTGKDKRFVFWDGERLVYKKDVKHLSTIKDESIHPDYANLVDSYNKSPHGSRVVKLFLKEIPDSPDRRDTCRSESWFYEDNDRFIECDTNYRYDNGRYIPDYCRYNGMYWIDQETGLFTYQGLGAAGFHPNRSQHRTRWDDPTNTSPYRDKTDLRLFAQTENGGEFQIMCSYGNPFRKDYS